ncbi:hypothetical protein OG474_09785 [Kribbella sp. NBC_01505]|uniref:hypothetical protein n=1 Tax=Kribbella sp. NBC_01505 TaxID=2903580 RepID=UPI0038685589
MPLINRDKLNQPLTLEERAASAAATTEAALVVFANAATDLETAAAELDELADIHGSEAVKHEDCADGARTAARRNRERASKIRESFTF